MRRRSHSSPTTPTGSRNDWGTLKTFFPYLWVYKWRVLFALLFLVGAKIAGMGVPLVLKQLIDEMGITLSDPKAILVLPVGILLAYGLLRLTMTVSTELREVMFSRVTQRAIRSVALRVFQHLHALSLRFHLDRQTGGMTRDIERGTRSMLSLVTLTLYNILPTIIDGWPGSWLPGMAIRYLVFRDYGSYPGTLHRLFHHGH